MITKHPLDKNNFKQNILFTNSAREAWGTILKGLAPSARILLPSYIGVTDREGSGIYDPVINLNVDHDFYLLNEDLGINIEEIKTCLKDRKYDLILLVHYFGFKIQNSEKVIELCHQNNLIVVEDCAHLFNFKLYNYSNVGTKSDYAFYSLHKNFPFDSGGMLVDNNEKLSIIKSKKHTSEIHELLIAYDSKSIADKRIENYNLLKQILADFNDLIPLKGINQGDIPNSFPVLVKDGLREALYFYLIENNIPVIALYYRLIDSLSDARFLSMQKISNSILNLPIHQDIDKNDLFLLVNKIKEFYEK